MRAEARQHFGEHRLALRRGQRLREIIVAAIAINDGLRQAELFGDRLADRLGIERLVDALRVGPGVLALAFGQVVATMVRGPRDRIIHAGRVEPREKLAAPAVAPRHRAAPSAAPGAGAVATIA